MPAFVNSRFGLSGIKEEDGTMVCPFDLKKSRNDWRTCALVITSFQTLRRIREIPRKASGSFFGRNADRRSAVSQAASLRGESLHLDIRPPGRPAVDDTADRRS